MAKRVAVVGVTGAVGVEMLKVLAERDYPVSELVPLASARSAGKQITWKGGEHTVRELTPESFKGVDVALFSAGGGISREYAVHATKAGCVVVDNSSAFRMKPGVPLVVPEVNPDAMTRHPGLIANPNCSTIIAAVAVWPLYEYRRVKRMIVSTYQAVSGAGAAGLQELERQQRQKLSGEPVTCEKFKHPIVDNLFVHDTPVGENGYNEEENKMRNETRKIFGDEKLLVAATCVRVPVPRAHCESINLEFERSISVAEVRQILSNTPGVKLVDDREGNHFPMPNEASDQDLVLVGHIRQDASREDGRGIELFVAGDQIRKGAATNAVQIAERLL
ncbi:MAG: aspartate-semialdehyde dehydrogenase [Phycisphaerae bacterium]